MQTFLPYPDFAKSAACLDRQRLGKQRVECLQLLRALLLPGKSGWVNHPAARMWRGYNGHLLLYGLKICDEWWGRGYKDSVRDKMLVLSELKEEPELIPYLSSSPRPPWLGDPAFHASHRSNLLRKDPVWYGRFGWEEPDNLPYVWPVP